MPIRAPSSDIAMLGSNMISWWPLISRLFSPCSTKNMPSVVMNEGIPKTVVTKPLMIPTVAAQPSAMASASHSFMSLVTNRMAQMIGVKAKFWPTERSNSPQIMSIVTPIATMPMVEATVVIAVIVCGDQKFGVCSVKNSTTPSRPRTGASSRTFNSASRSDMR